MLTLFLWTFVQKDVVEVCNVWTEKILNLSSSRHAVVQFVTCGFVWLTENCFSSCFIMAQGGKQKTENIFRTQTADCFSGGQSFNPSYVTCAVLIFRVEGTRKWYRQQQSFWFFFIINIFPNLIQLFVSSWSDFAQEDATITDRLWNCTATHTYMLPNNFF